MADQTAADTLRAAATRLRELAELCPPWPWTYNEEDQQVIAADSVTVADVFALSDNQIRNIGAYMVAMHPGAAIALADHFDAYAERLEHPIVLALAKMGGKSSLRDAAETETSTALDLARLLLAREMGVKQ